MTPNVNSKFSKKDLWYSVFAGVETGVIGWLVLDFLGIKLPAGLPLASLILIVPVLWIVGVNLGYILGQALPFFNQFGKFAAIGFTNFAVDSGIVNLLIASTGIATGFWFGVFKAISFFTASIHSYFWNKHWVFEAGDRGNPASQFGKFFAVSIAAMIINVAAASFTVNFVPHPAAMTAATWANVGTIVGSACALVFSFIGFRLAVFKNK